ncbi:TetR/AcrR family transcriptional regulator [Paenibacillus aestuarii]|uniref:Helix-turn-helix domain containing protein n=1 Tax=Paenibacillus aestuarii TaxID=516965 RepID=A0ABW0K3A4_9BACL|nr:helix-turn-helix domain containing protein [Paenibacillus aestuarii]
MKEFFLKLGPEKQERVLNAALKEFAINGYDAASTNAIVREAGISKGLLFHYFNSKKELFLFLYDYALGMVEASYVSRIDLAERDVLMRCRQISLLKIELIHKHPDIFNFIMAANFKRGESMQDELESRNKLLIAASYDRLFANIDETQFRPEVDLPRALQILAWTMEGFANAQQRLLDVTDLGQINYDKLMTELDAYFAIFRTSFYQKDGG